MIKVTNLKKTFGQVEALKGINESMNENEVVCIMGPSGCGKSTFLRCLDLLDVPTEGEVIIENMTCNDTNEDQLRKNMGFVFGNFNLFPHMNVMDNVAIGMLREKTADCSKAQEQAIAALKKVGMEEKAFLHPDQINGVEKQKIAIARALINNPKVLLFDEPTQGLSSEMAEEVVDLIKQLANEGKTVIVATNEKNLAKKVADSILVMDQGTIVEKGTPGQVHYLN
ncbi:MAG: ATP-binding cassette domain-containing protein [Anaerovorax sp.]|nr:ATP-binding cassette domain-containing protein [Anaerovorax sp.]